MTTPAFKQWVTETSGKNWPPTHIDAQAEYWIRAALRVLLKRVQAEANAKPDELPGSLMVNQLRNLFDEWFEKPQEKS